MQWFDEQIRERKQFDADMFEDSFREIAGAIMGKRLTAALEDDRQKTTDAIKAILQYYHIKAQDPPEDITDINEVLEYFMRPYGIMRRGIHLDKGWYRDAIGALLGTWKEDGSVVALLPYGLSGYRFYDQKTDRYVKVDSRNEELFEVDAIAFYKPFPLKSMSIRDFVHYLTEQIAPVDLAMMAGALGAATLVSMLLPKLTSKLFKEVADTGNTRMLLGIAIFMICATLSSLVFNVVQGLALGRINTKLNISVEAAAMMRVLSLPAAFFKRYNAGELSTRVQYLRLLSEKLIGMVMSTGLTSIFSLVYITQIFVYAPALVAPSLCVTFLTVAVSIARVMIHTGASASYMMLSSKEKGFTHELVGGIQKIRLAGAEQRAFAKWGKFYAEYASVYYSPPMLMRLSGTITMAISLIGTAVMYYMAIESGVAISDYYAFTSAYGMVNSAFLALAGIATSVATIKPTLNMVKPILAAVPEIDKSKSIVTSLTGRIELSNVTFRYGKDMPYILDKVSLKIRSGQYVAIVGKTGCGKSTLIRILLGFEKPEKGAVYYDGKDLSRLDPKSLRRKIGSVLQDGKLFMGDIYSNITIAAPWLTMDDAWEAAKTAGIAEDIRHMPMGMSTQISEGLGGISGGQRQRLMIARAIAPKPKILIFDEATSALDNLTQKRVSEALDQMKCTRIVIAHRLSTIRRCDRILVLDKGKIIEDGSYEKLLKKNGVFAELVARQQLGDTGHAG